MICTIPWSTLEAFGYASTISSNFFGDGLLLASATSPSLCELEMFPVVMTHFGNILDIDMANVLQMFLYYASASLLISGNLFATAPLLRLSWSFRAFSIKWVGARCTDHEKSPSSMGKSAMSMAIVYSYVKLAGGTGNCQGNVALWLLAVLDLPRVGSWEEIQSVGVMNCNVGMGWLYYTHWW